MTNLRNLLRPATLLAILLTIATAVTASDTAPALYSFDQCRGSASPYPAPDNRVPLPDSLTLVMINHVGRHGSRYETSPNRANSIRKALVKARNAGTLTSKGEQLLALVEHVIKMSDGNWGALDSIGMSEHRGIARRICQAWPGLINGARIEAISSYVPRCVMSMDEFTHEITRCNSNVEILTSSGRVNSPLMRPFAIDSAYLQLRAEAPWKATLNRFETSRIPLAPVEALIGKGTMTDDAMRSLAIKIYGFIAGLNASGVTDAGLDQYYTLEEANRMWECRNLTQYLERTTSSFSSLPSDIAAPLLADIINTTDEYISHRHGAPISLRFGHAETLMPLLALMEIPGCYYVDTDPATVDRHWMSFYVAPMATNIQMLVAQAPSGEYYVRLDLNERPVNFPDTDNQYVTWSHAYDYLNRLLQQAYERLSTASGK